MVVLIDYILVYSKDTEDHKNHLKLVLGKLKEYQLFTKLGKCEFWLGEIKFLGHAIFMKKVMVDPSKLEAVIIW